MKKKLLILILVLIVTGCTDKDDIIEEPELTEPIILENTGIVSDLTLDISSEDLPEGVSVDDVTITRHLGEIDESLQKYEPLAVFEMEPDGLTFDNPIPFAFTVPLITDQDFLVVYHLSGDNVEVISEIHLEHDLELNTTTISGTVSHFSKMLVTLQRAWKEIADRELAHDYLLDCAETIGAAQKKCEQYENWILNTWISRVDFFNIENSFLVKDFVIGPNNKCKASLLPATSEIDIDYKLTRYRTRYRQGQQGTNIEATDYGVVCKVSCHTWVCPEGQAEKEKSFTCKEGTYKFDKCHEICKREDTQSSRCSRDNTQFDCYECNWCHSGFSKKICEQSCNGICVQIPDEADNCMQCIPDDPEFPSDIPEWYTPKPTPQPEPEPTPECTWTCGGWSECSSGGTQTRTCSSSPSPCTGTNPNPTSKGCTPPEPEPTPECTWTCGGWSECSSGGTQTRTCSSSPSPCTGTNSNPTSQDCTPPEPEPTCDMDAFNDCMMTTGNACSQACPQVLNGFGCEGLPVDSCTGTDIACLDTCTNDCLVQANCPTT